MGDWGRMLNGEEPGSAREAPASQNWLRDITSAAYARIEADRVASMPAKRAAEEAALAATILDEAAAAAAREAERAADALIVAQCVTVSPTPCGGKRYSLENLEFSGCRLHRETTNWRFGNRNRTLLVLPLEAVWTVSWDCFKDGAPHRRFVHTESGASEVVASGGWGEPHSAFASDAKALQHNPFAALAKKGS